MIAVSTKAKKYIVNCELTAGRGGASLHTDLNSGQQINLAQRTSPEERIPPAPDVRYKFFGLLIDGYGLILKPPQMVFAGDRCYIRTEYVGRFPVQLLH